jgi:two-component system NtrC family sensor kinase
VSIYSIPPLLTFFCFLALALLTLIRGRPCLANRLFAIVCGIGSLLHLDILVAFNTSNSHLALWVSRIDHALVVWTIPLYVHFFHAYLQVPSRRWLLPVAYAYAFVLMLFTPTPLYFAAMRPFWFGHFAIGGTVYLFFAVGAILATTYALVLVYRDIIRETAAVRRNSLKYVLAGFGLMGLLNVLNLLPSFGLPIYPPGCLSFIPLTVFWVGLFRHDLLDMGVVIQKGVLYSILTVLVSGLYALVITGAGLWMVAPVHVGTDRFHLLFFALVVIIFGPLKDKTQGIVDRLFARDRYNYQQTLKQLSRMIAAVREVDQVVHKITDVIVNAVKVDLCAVFIYDAAQDVFSAAGFQAFGPLRAGDTFIQAMSRGPKPLTKSHLLDRQAEPLKGMLLDTMAAMGASVAVPMFFQHRLQGFIAIGEKRSGELFFTEDLNLLETLANNAALAIENARSYAALALLNKELEDKVDSRTHQLCQALAEKERTQEQLVRSESLAAIGQLVAGTAHELNNPLASSISLVQSAIEDLSDADALIDPTSKAQLTDDLRFAEKELQRARAIVSSLLGLSRQTQTYTEAVDLNVVIADAVKVLANRCKHSAVQVIEDYAPDLPLLKGNFANLGQVALNIIGNAIDALADGAGTIFLTTAMDAGTGQVVFTCRDTGPGLAENVRKDIFKPFFTTKKPGAGTGLGLYICHEIVAKHDGVITCGNHPQGGALFKLNLPAGRPARSN